MITGGNCPNPSRPCETPRQAKAKAVMEDPFFLFHLFDGRLFLPRWLDGVLSLKISKISVFRDLMPPRSIGIAVNALPFSIWRLAGNFFAKNYVAGKLRCQFRGCGPGHELKGVQPIGHTGASGGQLFYKFLAKACRKLFLFRSAPSVGGSVPLVAGGRVRCAGRQEPQRAG